MKIAQPFQTRKHRDGIASIVMLILVALVLSFILANISTLSALHNDVKRVEQRQLRRINATTAPANTNSQTTLPAK